MKLRDDALFDPLSGNAIAFFIGITIISFSAYVNWPATTWEGPVPILLGVTISCAWAIRLHAYREAYRISIGKRIVHWKRIVVRSIIALFIGFVIHVYGDGWTVVMLYKMIACAAYIGGLFWLEFDFVLNHDRHLQLFYVSRWYRTSLLDKIFRRDPRAWLVSKLIVYFAALYLYVQIFSL